MRTFSALGILGLMVSLTTVSLHGAFAGELDNENSAINADQRAQASLPGSVVVRVNTQDNSLAVLQSADKLKAEPLTGDETFIPVQADQKIAASTQELNKDSSTDSWFYFNGCNWYAPSFYYGGFNYYYQPYFNYNFGGFNYYYYWYRW